MPEVYAIYARRFSVAWGWRWVEERECTIYSADDWLAIFKKDEPDIEFVVRKLKRRN